MALLTNTIFPIVPSFVSIAKLTSLVCKQAMYSNRKERAELLEALVISYKEIKIPKFHQVYIIFTSQSSYFPHVNFTISLLPLQRIHLLWGEDDKIFKLEFAQKMKE